MLVSDWMTKKVITVTPQNSLLDCRRIFKKENINRLPVIDKNNKLVGIISSADLLAFTPELPTGMEILEAFDTMSDTKVKHMMTKNPSTIRQHQTIETAALKMLNNHIDCLPVVDEEKHVVGLVTGITVFRAMLSVSGAIAPGEEMGFDLPDKQGSLKEILAILREMPVRIVSVLSAIEKDDMRMVKIRFTARDEHDTKSVNNVIEAFRNYPGIRYWTQGGVVRLKKDD